ncbi:MAG TPA: hypothetical protein VK524_06900 [Polyangiaceae bacterium]|nr:hypothetical protein [Polyangiaceae bacterium]
MRSALVFLAGLTYAPALAAQTDARGAPVPVQEEADPGAAESGEEPDVSETEPAAKPDCPEPEPSAEDTVARDPLEGPRRGTLEKDVVLDARGFAIALRVGWGIPQGEQQTGVDAADRSLGMLPVWLDLGYRVTTHLLVGVYAHYAFAFVNACPAGADCNASDVRFGLQAQWHFGARQSIDHWVGIGTGFEIYEEEVEGVTRRFTGFEYVNLQLGEDFSLGHRLGLGPFVSVSLGEFRHLEQSMGRRRLSDEEIPASALHLWAVLGLRLSFGA